VLVTVDVVSEGFDIPAAGCAILLRPTQSLGLYLQQVGRVLRPAPGKAAAIVLDHVGNVHRHGWPDDPREWSLDDRLKRAGAAGPPAPSVRTCEVCFAAFKPAPMCPCCGSPAKLSAREIQHRDGVLQELERNQQRRQVGKARSLSELLTVAKQRGYAPGWAYRIHQARGKC
jgi:superfamily II DNA or RNA helicase